MNLINKIEMAALIITHLKKISCHDKNYVL